METNFILTPDMEEEAAKSWDIPYWVQELIKDYKRLKGEC